MSTTNTQTQRSLTFLESIPVRDLLKEHAGLLVIGKREGSLAVLQKMNKRHGKEERRKKHKSGDQLNITPPAHTDTVVLLLLSSFESFVWAVCRRTKKSGRFHIDSSARRRYFFFLWCASAQLLPLPVGLVSLVVDLYYCPCFLYLPVFSVVRFFVCFAKTTYVDGKRVEEGTLLRVLKVLIQLLLPNDASRALFLLEGGRKE